MRGTKERKKVKGWSTEEMKDKANSLLEEDTEELWTRKVLNQEEMNQCWKKLAERMEEEVLDKYRARTAKGRLTEAEAPRWNGGMCEEANNTGYESGQKIAGQESSLCSENTTCSVCKARMRHVCPRDI